MRNIKIIFLISCLLPMLFVNSVFAEDFKIGVVNTISILEQSPQALSADALIKKEFSSRDRNLVAKQKKVKSMEDRFTNDKAIMTESEVKKLERNIINVRRDLKRKQEEFREDVNFRFNEERAKIQKEIFEAIQAVAQKNGYDLILFDGVAYASPKTDLSDKVIAYLEKKKKN